MQIRIPDYLWENRRIPDSKLCIRIAIPDKKTDIQMCKLNHSSKIILWNLKQMLPYYYLGRKTSHYCFRSTGKNTWNLTSKLLYSLKSFLKHVPLPNQRAKDRYQVVMTAAAASLLVLQYLAYTNTHLGHFLCQFLKKYQRFCNPQL